MKERPILFSTPMVQAIPEGRKTMTRRVVKNQSDCNVLSAGHEWEIKEFFARCPYGQIGDRLWVKETYYQYGQWIKNGTTKTGKQKYKFVAANNQVLYCDTVLDTPIQKNSYRELGWYKRSAMFMPHQYSRICLEITNIRVERLQDISEEDSISEGIEVFDGNSNYKNYLNGDGLNYYYVKSAKLSFQSLWQSIHSKESWESNPYVWVIEFKVINK